jgi:hypothetical protein
MGYCSRVARRAWNETKPWLGLAPARPSIRRFLAMLILGGGIGAALIAGDRVAREHWYWAFVIALAGFLLVIVVWNFLRAPALLDADAQAMIAALSRTAERSGAAQEDIDALQSAYISGRELLRAKSLLTAEELAPRVNEWFVATAELVRRIGSKNEAFTFATAADFAAVPAGEKAPAGLLLTRLAKLKQIIDRMMQQRDGAPRVTGFKWAADED